MDYRIASPENNAALYEILSNKNSHYTRVLHIYVIIKRILCQYSRLTYIRGCVVKEVVLFLGLYGTLHWIEVYFC